MNPLDPLSSFVEKQKEEEKDPNLKLYIFSSTSQVAASSSSSSSSKLAFATCFTATAATPHDHQGLNFHHVHQGEKSIANSLVKSSVREAEDQIRRKEDYKYSNNEASAKYWMCSKMRLMQKMMINTDKKLINIGGSNSDQKADTIRRNNNNSNDDDEGRWLKIGGVHNHGVRVCSDCNTTTTPLWRSGPQGPKSLCNACGIRKRKARRAMAEAANGGGAIVASEAVSGKELHKEKKSRLSCHGDGNAANNVARVKNKCNNKIITADVVSSDSQSEGMNNNDNSNNRNNNKNELSLDGHNFTLRLSKSSTTGSAFGRVFPRDEEEAAILLMELSCGLLHTC